MGNIVNILNEKEDLISGKGAEINKIEEAENRLNLKFYEDYKEYLLKFGMVSFEGHEITGLGIVERLNVMNVTLEAKERYSQVPDDFYVIEDLNMDYIMIWQNSSGEIFETTYNKEPVKICDDLAQYFEQMCE